MRNGWTTSRLGSGAVCKGAPDSSVIALLSLSAQRGLGCRISISLRPTLRLQAPYEYAFLRVQPILGFVPDDRARTIDDARRHFFAPVRRQAMHEDRFLVGERHQALVH